MADCFSWFADAQIAVHEMAIADASEAELFPQELAHLSRAVPARVREFAAGRICARHAMARLGHAPAPIRAAPDRAPLWPPEVVGSITHAGGHAAAAVARRADGYAAIGIDLEPAEALPAGILDLVCMAGERAWLEAQPASDRAVLARAIFSAKECAYKTQYPLSRQMLDFEDMAIALDLSAGLFLAEFTRACPPFSCGARIAGRLRIAGGFIACAAVLGPETPG